MSVSHPVRLVSAQSLRGDRPLRQDRVAFTDLKKKNWYWILCCAVFLSFLQVSVLLFPFSSVRGSTSPRPSWLGLGLFFYASSDTQPWTPQNCARTVLFLVCLFVLFVVSLTPIILIGLYLLADPVSVLPVTHYQLICFGRFPPILLTLEQNVRERPDQLQSKLLKLLGTSRTSWR